MSWWKEFRQPLNFFFFAANGFLYLKTHSWLCLLASIMCLITFIGYFFIPLPDDTKEEEDDNV